MMGYVKSGSVMSGAMGLAFGGLAGFGAYQTSVNPSNYGLAVAVPATLTGVMGYRFVSSGKFMPAGLVALISVAMVLKYGLRMAGVTGAVTEVPSKKD
jgi:uncharacterized membrane protein (UPF0136 family)